MAIEAKQNIVQFDTEDVELIEKIRGHFHHLDWRNPTLGSDDKGTYIQIYFLADHYQVRLATYDVGVAVWFKLACA